jgi:hypothetical protein
MVGLQEFRTLHNPSSEAEKTHVSQCVAPMIADQCQLENSYNFLHRVMIIILHVCGIENCIRCNMVVFEHKPRYVFVTIATCVVFGAMIGMNVLASIHDDSGMA